MANQFLKLRRSAVPGRIPSTSSLDFGEIALNTYDGLAFIKKSGSIGEEIITIGANLVSVTGSRFFVPVFNTTSSLITSSIYQSGSFTAIGATIPVDLSNPDRLFIDAGDTTSYNLLSGHGEINNYLQLNIQNFSSGAIASSDIVATADNGSEDNYYINMGINNSGYNIPDGIGVAGDAYLFNTGGDLLIGNTTLNNKVIIFNGGTPAIDNARLFITAEGTVGINASDANLNNPEALLIEPLPGNSANTFSNLIIGRGAVHESYLQFNLINQGTGSYASADIVASNDISTETSNYVDMGINSSNHIVDTAFAPGGPNDTYLLSTGRDLLIGSSTSGSITLWTGTNFDDKANAKLTLKNNNQHAISGSLDIEVGETDSYNLVQIKGKINTYAQVTVQNTSSGSVASSDIVAINNLGNDTSYYIDMGINSSGYSLPNVVGNANDAYLFSVAEHLHIGNTANYPIQFFAGGFDSDANRKFQLSPNNYHELTGSIDISGSIYNRLITQNNSLSGSIVAVNTNTGLFQYTNKAAFATSADTASSADNFTVRGTLTAQTIIAQTITSSTDFVTGSTRFGSLSSNTHQFTGSVGVTGSLNVNGPATINDLTGSLFGTASWANNATTASYILQAVSASFATSASQAITASYILQAESASFATSASQAITASYILNAISASFATSASQAITASYILNAESASFAASASQAITASYILQAVSASFATSASQAITASYALNAGAGSGFPFSGSAVITGSLLVSGSGLVVTGSLSTLETFNINNARFNSTSSATTTGTTIVSSNATGSFNSAFYNYYISSGSNARAGQIMSVWSGSTIQYTEVTTNDIGNTNTASLAVTLATGNVRLSFTAPGVWTVRSIVNLL